MRGFTKEVCAVTGACDREKAATRSAAALFKGAEHIHGLTRTSLRLVKYAAGVNALHHEISDHATRLRHVAHALGRLAGCTSAELRIIRDAAAIPFGEKNWLGWFANGAAARRGAGEISLRIAAILHIVAAFSHAPDGVEISRPVDDGRGVRIVVEGGPVDGRLSRLILDGAALWNAVFFRPITGVMTARECVGNVPLVGPDDGMAEALARILRRQVEQFVSRAYGLECREDIEYVHEMRVALRRARSALRACRKAAGPRAAEFADECRHFAAALGTVRDIDVFLGFLRKWREEHRGGSGGFIERLIVAQRKRRSSAYRRLLAVFDDERYEAFCERYHAMVEAGGALVDRESKAGRAPARKAAPKLLKKRLRGLFSCGRRLDALSPRELHRARIQCKRLRYAAEFFGDVYGGGLGKLTKTASRLQDLLGEYHDADVYSETISRYHDRSRSSASGEKDGPEALLADLRKRRAKDLKAASRLWRDFVGRSGGKKAMKAIASPRGKKSECP
jgi:CHAD domain-containing protein